MGVFLPQLLQSLSCIHKQGYIHSDLKPGNVLFFQRSSKQCPDVKIADFGLARPIGTKFDRDFVGNHGSYFSTVPPLVERFDRRGIEPFELRSEFLESKEKLENHEKPLHRRSIRPKRHEILSQNRGDFARIHQKSKNFRNHYVQHFSQIFGEIPRNVHQNLSNIQ